MQLPREVQHRRLFRQRNPMCGRQLIHANLRFGSLQRPRKMMNMPHQHLPSVRSKQTVSLRQKMFQRAVDTRRRNLTQSAIVRFKPDALPRQQPSASVLDRPIRRNLSPHAGWKIWQMKQRPRPRDSKRTRCIERKKIHPAQPCNPRSYIRPQIQLAKLPCARNGDASLPQRTCPHPIHPERNNTHPRRSVEAVHFKPRRQQPRYRLCRNRPMRKQQIVPTLCHPPLSGRQQVSPMFDGTQNIHSSSIVAVESLFADPLRQDQVS